MTEIKVLHGPMNTWRIATLSRSNAHVSARFIGLIWPAARKILPHRERSTRDSFRATLSPAIIKVNLYGQRARDQLRF